MPLCDCHCHLQDQRLANGWDAMIQRALSADVARLVCCGSEPGDWPDVLALSGACSAIVPAFGVHPWHADPLPDNWSDELKRLLDIPGALLGETGLDAKFSSVPMPRQMDIFRQQAAIAAERGIPLSIHCVKAWEPLISVLKEFTPRLRFHVHSYGGGVAMIGPLLDLNGWFSFSGALTRPSNKKAHDAIRRIPPNRLLIETDAPDIPLYLNNGVDYSQPNEPANLPLILDCAAGLLDMDPLLLKSQLWRNSMEFLGLPETGSPVQQADTIP